MNLHTSQSNTQEPTECRKPYAVVWIHLNSVFSGKIQEIPLYHLHKLRVLGDSFSRKSRGSINIFWSKFYRDLCIWLSIIATTSVISIHGYLWVKVRETGRRFLFLCHTVFILWRKSLFLFFYNINDFTLFML